MDMMQDHVGETAFAGYKSTSNINLGSSMALDSDDESQFADVMKLKDSISFNTSENFFNVSEIISKEVERETFSTQRAKGYGWAKLR